MKIIILIPYGVKTGGPEALHQLSDSLIECGYDAFVWYVFPGDLESIAALHATGQLSNGLTLDLGVRNSIVPEYQVYQVRPLGRLQLNEELVFVFAETYLEWLRYFDTYKKIIWWLSVDNSFRHLSADLFNLNSLRKFNVFHAYQSSYAHNFIRALGLNSCFSLSDHTPALEYNHENSTKKDISLNGSHKVIFNIDQFAMDLSSFCASKVHILRGMTRSELYSALDSSAIYIDLGSLPGKDRMPREALLRNCCVFTLKAGAYLDFKLKDEFYFEIEQVNSIRLFARKVISEYEYYLPLFYNAKSLVTREKFIFNKEVGEMMRYIGC